MKKTISALLALILALSAFPAFADEGKLDAKGLVTTKTAVRNDDGTYTITLEAYTTGSVVIKNSSMPVDVVLVLDQSASMAYDFSGGTAKRDSDRRQYAMKQAVNGFIDLVADMYDAKTSDHRIAIVTFGQDAAKLSGWTAADAKGTASLKNKITGLPGSPTSRGTNTDKGLEQAGSLFGSSYSYSGSNTERQKVVILFTDGAPGSLNLTVSVADSAIASAKSLKDSGVLIYGVGIFEGADPKQLYGKSFVTKNYGSYECSGKAGSVFGYAEITYASPEYTDPDAIAANRFMNYVSSNYASASSLGLTDSVSMSDIPELKAAWDAAVKKNPKLKYSTPSLNGYKVTKTFSRTGNGYYLSASDAGGLSDIFQTISESIQTVDLDMGPETLVKDIVSEYFVQSSGDIRTYVASSTGDGNFSEKVETELNVVYKDRTLDISGFDFNGNAVTKTKKEDGTYGKKLVVEFDVEPAEGFWGGNGVPTNGSESGVYTKDKNGNYNLIEQFDEPHVDVPIKRPDAPEDRTVYIYCGNEIPSIDDIMGGCVPGEDVNTDFVEFKVCDEGLLSNTEDSSVIRTVIASPKNGGEEKEVISEPAVISAKVFRPELTWTDTECYYGDMVDMEGCGPESVIWTLADGRKDTQVLDKSSAPELSYGFSRNKTAMPAGTVSVDVTVINGETDITKHTKQLWDKCGEDETKPKGSEFLIHPKSCTLTVTKSGCDETKDEGQFFIFDIEGGNAKQSIRACVKGNGSVTVTGLPTGNYSIHEEGNWSWRYASEDQKVTLSAGKDKDSAVVIVKNSRDKIRWLTEDAYAVNSWDSSGVIRVNSEGAPEEVPAGVNETGENGTVENGTGENGTVENVSGAE